MDEISYRAADALADLEFARTLHHRAYRDVVIRQFGLWDETIQDGFFSAKWGKNSDQIILLDGSPIGALSIAQHADHIFLYEIQILPEYQGRGLGSRIIKQQLEYAQKLHLPLRLQVLRENRAKQLYLRLGFSVIGTSDTHIILERQT